jgi:hypothetical protein
MIDSFVILTPLLLLPMALLLVFLGCSFDTSSPTIVYEAEVQITFRIRFWVTNGRVGNNFCFQIFDDATNFLADAVVQISQTEDDGQGNGTSLLSHEFERTLTLSEGTNGLYCVVLDLGAGTECGTGESLVSGCENNAPVTINSERYLVRFFAGLSDDGTTPTGEFEVCSASVL